MSDYFLLICAGAFIVFAIFSINSGRRWKIIHALGYLFLAAYYVFYFLKENFGISTALITVSILYLLVAAIWIVEALRKKSVNKAEISTNNTKSR